MIVLRLVFRIGFQVFLLTVVMLTTVGLAGCASSSKSRLLKMPKVPKLSMPKLENVPIVGKNKRKSKLEPEARGGGPREEVKAKPSIRSGGAVEFRGFTAAALQDFRLIPEKGTDLFVPQNQVYQGIDGFWWRPQRGMWFKIPNHCSVVVKAAPDAVTPSAFTSTSERGKVGVGIQALRGRAVEPAFYPDAGKTSHPTDYPFSLSDSNPGDSVPERGSETLPAP